MNNNILIMLGALFLPIYLTVAFIAWRNIKFSTPFKLLFSISAVPLFIVAMVLNIWLVSSYTPGLLRALEWSKNLDYRLFEAFFTFLVAVPIPVVIIWCWYRLIQSLDRTLKIRLSPTGQ